jgi:hypothetical protein
MERRTCGELLPSPLWGGVGGGGQKSSSSRRRSSVTGSPPSPALPQKGGGSRPSKPPRQRSTSTHLACARAADRPDAPTARPLRRDGLAHRRGLRLRQRPAHGRTGPASACARGRGADLQEPGPHQGMRASAAAHARTPAGLWMAGRERERFRHRLRQYSVALSRSGAARSCSGPPTRPCVRSARIVPALGRLARSTWREASHSFERTIAFAHWK